MTTQNKEQFKRFTNVKEMNKYLSEESKIGETVILDERGSKTIFTADIEKCKKGCGKVLCTNTDYDGEMVICGKYGSILCDDCKLKLTILQHCEQLHLEWKKKFIEGLKEELARIESIEIDNKFWLSDGFYEIIDTLASGEEK